MEGLGFIVIYKNRGRNVHSVNQNQAFFYPTFFETLSVKQSLGKLPYLEITRDMWEAAGEISASLRGAGITITLSDLIIACVALSGDHEIFTIDPHFEKVDGLRLHNVP